MKESLKEKETAVNIMQEDILMEGITMQDAWLRLRAREAEKSPKWQAKNRAKQIKTWFPKEAEQTITMADQAMEGMLVLPGTGPDLYFVGNPPRWAENPCGDYEYTYQLNRMEHWGTLCAAYSLTGEQRYADKVLEELENWLDTVPCHPLFKEDGTYNVEAFDGCSCWRALEVGIRGYRTWPYIVEHLLDTPGFTETLFEKLLYRVYEHCRVLYEISPRLWPRADHNHYLMENLGLLTFSCMFSDLKDADVWRAHALRELERCMENQVTKCGGQIEGCPSYHNACVYWFSLKLNLAEKYGFSVNDSYGEQLKHMFAHSVWATRPCGGSSPWGDSHTALTETMALAAVGCYMAFGDLYYLQAARHFYPMETIMEDFRTNLWNVKDLGRLAEDLRELTPVLPKQPCFAWQKDLDQVFFRSSWDNHAASVMTACRTPVQNQHAHMDPGGFDFTAYGEPLVCDPGIYTYKECDERRWMKGIRWHNCLNIDGRDPWEYRGSWEYGPQREGRILKAGESEGMSYAVSEHHNYDPAVCKRAIALIDGTIVLVLDLVRGLRGGETVELNFNVDRTEVEFGPNGIRSCREGHPNISIVMSEGWTPRRIAGKISTGNDIWHDSTIVRFQKRVSESQCASAALLIPVPAEETALAAKSPTIQRNGDDLEVEFQWKQTEYRLRMTEDRLERMC